MMIDMITEYEFGAKYREANMKDTEGFMTVVCVWLGIFYASHARDLSLSDRNKKYYVVVVNGRERCCLIRENKRHRMV